MNFLAAAKYLIRMVTGGSGSGTMSQAEAVKLAREAHVNAQYLFTEPSGQKPGNYPGHLSGALSDSFTTLVFKENQRWKMRMGFDQSKFFAGQVHKRTPVDYASILQERGYLGPGSALADVGYDPIPGTESEWFVQTKGVPIYFQGGVGGVG